jgi:predicted nucleotidyltransferase
MTQPDLRTQLQPVVTALQQSLGDDLVALVLFGSRARGDARPDSDWDLLLIAENLPASPWQRSQHILALLPQAWRHRVTILAHTATEWFGRVTPLALDIALDGMILYDNPRYLLPTRLADLRQQLRQRGLARRQIDEGEWIWLWQDEAQSSWELEWTI